MTAKSTKMIFAILFVLFSTGHFFGSAIAVEPKPQTSLADVPADVKKFVIFKDLDAKGLQAFANTSKANNTLVQQYLAWLKQNGKPLPGFLSFSCPTAEQIKGAKIVSDSGNQKSLLIGTISWSVNIRSLIPDVEQNVRMDVRQEPSKLKINCRYAKKGKDGSTFYSLNRKIDNAITDVAKCEPQDSKLEVRTLDPLPTKTEGKEMPGKSFYDVKAGTIISCPYK
jgi:hypothetical protein